MAYSMQEDVRIAAGGTASLIALTDWERNETVDLVVLAKFQARADATINGYLRLRAATPLVNPTEEIVDCAASLAVFYLREARQGLTTELIEAQALRIKWLEDIRDGRIRIDEPAPTKSSAVKAAFIENTGAVSRKSLGPLL